MVTLLQDLKYGVRMMARSPVVAGVAILSLSLGIAANASMFAVLNSFLLEPLPYEDQEELVLLRSVRTGQNADLAGGISVPDFRDLEVASRSIESATAYEIERANLTGLDVPEQLNVVVSTPSIFDVFGVQPALGRGFRANDGVGGDGRVLVLEHDFWQRRFLGDPGVVGRSVTLDGVGYTVVGVLPETFDLIPANVHAFRASDFSDRMEDRSSKSLLAFVRLRDGSSVDQLRRELETSSARLAAEFPEANRGMELLAQPIRDFFPGRTDAQLLKVLTAVTLFGLLIACANVANLLLSRAEERQTEMAVRTALGAGRGRILKQMLTESVLMGTVAGVGGAVLAVWMVDWLQGSMPAERPAAMVPRLDGGVLVATMLVSIFAGLAFGSMPALHAVSHGLGESLGSGGRGGTAGRRRKRIRNVFVVAEMAVALALLVGSGFLIQAFERLANDDPGFAAAGLMTFEVSVLDDRYVEDSDVVSYQSELLRALGDVPGVERVAMMSSLPRARGSSRADYTIDGRPVPEANELPSAGLQSVNADFFQTLGVAIRRGRGFAGSDRLDAEPVAIVSEAFAEREFGDEEAIGARISVLGASRRIVGVAEDILQQRMALAGRGGEQIYVPAAQLPIRTPKFLVRAEGDAGALSHALRQAVWSVEADQPVAELRTLEAVIDESLAGPRAISAFLMAMGALALTLAAMGIYGVMAHAVAQQRREIGIRMALGAGRSTVVGEIAWAGLALIGVGVIGGVPLSYLMYRIVASALNLFETDLGLAYPAGLASALITVAVVATVVPASRASRVAPVAALKE